MIYKGQIPLLEQPKLGSKNIEKIYRGNRVVYGTPPFVGFDDDAAAFLIEARITNDTIAGAINTLVVGLKSDGLWNRFYALYPFVGGSANTHKFNLKNPSNTDAAFRLAFTGSWTHNSNGITGNGIDTIANTFFNINDSAIEDDFHMSIYSRTNISLSPPLPTGQLQIDMGAFVSPNEFAIIPRTEHNIFSGYLGVQPAQPYNQNAPGQTINISRGQFLVTRSPATPTTTNRLLNDDNFQSPMTQSVGKPVGITLAIGAENRTDGPFAVSTKNLAFSSFGLGLTRNQGASLYSRIQTFQTTLGRQVG
jgi:hypothetical protein